MGIVQPFPSSLAGNGAMLKAPLSLVFLTSGSIAYSQTGAVVGRATIPVSFRIGYIAARVTNGGTATVTHLKAYTSTGNTVVSTSSTLLGDLGALSANTLTVFSGDWTQTVVGSGLATAGQIGFFADTGSGTSTCVVEVTLGLLLNEAHFIYQ